MKPHIRELLTNLKAATLIGHPDTLQSALNGVRTLPDEALPPHELVPLGRALTRLPAKTLRPLRKDPDPAIRALAAVALGERYLQGKDATANDLHAPANDPNPEVCTALARSLAESPSTSPERLLPLAESWLRPSPHERGNRRGFAALQILPACAPAPKQVAVLLQPLHTITDHDFRAVLLECLNTFAETGSPEPVLKLLSGWARQPDPNVWVITRTLSAAWARSHSPRAVVILNDLAEKVGMIRSVGRALGRHESGSC